MGLLVSAFLTMHAWAAPADSTPHCPEISGRRIIVAPGVALNVTEWGGKGPAIVFLSGVASTAFAFDDFAPLFSDRFRVLGITRRGVPPSDRSKSGYDVATLTQDIATILDSLHIKKAHVVGWSYGGNEAVHFAVDHPKRVLSVVLLDTYDNSREAATFRDLNGVKSPSIRTYATDSASVLAMMWQTRRLGFRPLPLKHFCASNRFGESGRYLGSRVDARLRDSIGSGAKLLQFQRVSQPVLAIFRVTRAVQDAYPDYPAMDSTDRRLADAQFAASGPVLARARDRIRKELPRVQVVEVPGAAHHLFVTDPEVVFGRMRSFYKEIRALRR